MATTAGFPTTSPQGGRRDKINRTDRDKINRRDRDKTDRTDRGKTNRTDKDKINNTDKTGINKTDRTQAKGHQPREHRLPQQVLTLAQRLDQWGQHQHQNLYNCSW